MSDETSSASAIAEELGVAKWKVYATAKASNVPMDGSRTPAQHQKLLDALKKPSSAPPQKQRRPERKPRRVPPAVVKDDQVELGGLSQAMIAVAQALEPLNDAARGRVLQALSVLYGEEG